MKTEPSEVSLISQLEAWLPDGQHYPPGLYLVATPIGNLGDITLRALYVLHKADIVLCEDTRVTRKLLSAYGISARTLAYHEHNAARMHGQVMEHLASGKRIAVVSDAGTPLISDPGFGLVQAAYDAGHAVTSLPGASSVTTALTLAGLPAEPFLFAGFLPPKATARRKSADDLAAIPATLVLLEAPHRLDATLKTLAEALGNRPAAILRELTKRHEEAHRAPLAELATHYDQEGNPKGEIVLVIAPPVPKIATDADLDATLKAALACLSVKEASQQVAEELRLPRKQVYARALELKDAVE